jgi:prepilin-type N-terminal cleavage/methylation domain-containing protein
MTQFRFYARQHYLRGFTQPLRMAGFTLIELLVVISIIGLLASVVIASLDLGRAKARNTARIAQVDQLRSAFYFADRGTYPNPAVGVVCVSVTCNNWANLTTDATVDAYFAQAIQKPTDPVGGNRTTNGFTYLSPANSLGPLFAGHYFIMYVLEWSASDNCGLGIPDTHQWHNNHARTDPQFFAGSGANLWCYLQIDQ